MTLFIVRFFHPYRGETVPPSLTGGIASLNHRL